ncbi:MAG: creatininase family protein [Pirellulales bacterium]|nr:creatininase family protein [Pirellulales bacterium]
MKFQEMTAFEINDIDREKVLVVLPIAAVEQHGPHMPTGTDNFLCTGLAEALEQSMPDKVLLAPTQWLGASAHHLRIGATLDSSLEVYIETLMGMARSVLNDGFPRILLLNGHGGNIDPMRVALRRIQNEYVDRLLSAACYWDVADELIKQSLDGAHKFVGHACEFETSMLMHLRPELVKLELVKDAGELITDNLGGVYISRDLRQRTAEGCTGRPDLASAEKGRMLFAGILEALVETVDSLLAQPTGTEYTDHL